MKLKLKILIIEITRLLIKQLYFFPIKKNRVLFISYNGCKYNDNPKYIYDCIIGRNNTLDLDIVWVLNDSIYNSVSKDQNVTYVNHSNRLVYIYYILTSHVIITNDFLEIYLPKRKKQTVLNTWHGGGAYKTVALTAKNPSEYMRWYQKKQTFMTSAFVLSSEYFNETVVQQSYNFWGETLRTGMPRNSTFFKNDNNLRIIVYKRLNIQVTDDDIIVLYAPTFRGPSETGCLSFNDGIIDIERVIRAFETRFRKHVIFLFRAHHAIKAANLNGDYIDVSNYSNMQDLLYVSDYLISDYSSCMWDFGLMNKPILLYTPDLKEYQDDRDFFMDINQWPSPLSCTNKELEETILGFDVEYYVRRIKDFNMQLKSYENANSDEMCTDWVLARLNC